MKINNNPVSLTEGTLTVQGTIADDKITVFHTEEDQIKVKFNEKVFSFDASEIKDIQVKGGFGDDQISFVDKRPEKSEVKYSISLIGNIGDDTISADTKTSVFIKGGFGNDRLQGGSGNDLIIGNFGEDIIDGGAGKDTIFGGYDNDRIKGGEGEDLLIGGEDDDTLITDSHDTFMTKKGNDQIKQEK